MELHKCDLCLYDERLYGTAIDSVYEEEDGKLWATNKEYETQINYCPACGYKAKCPVVIETWEDIASKFINRAADYLLSEANQNESIELAKTPEGRKELTRKMVEWSKRPKITDITSVFGPQYLVNEICWCGKHWHWVSDTSDETTTNCKDCPECREKLKGDE